MRERKMHLFFCFLPTAPHKRETPVCVITHYIRFTDTNENVGLSTDRFSSNTSVNTVVFRSLNLRFVFHGWLVITHWLHVLNCRATNRYEKTLNGIDTLYHCIITLRVQAQKWIKIYTHVYAIRSGK